MLQRVCLGKNVNRHFSLNFGKFCNTFRSLLSELSGFLNFLDSEVTPARSEKKSLKACQPPQFLYRILVQG